MTQPDLFTEIDMMGRMMIALEEIEACREFAALIPEVRTNLVFARPDAKIPADVMAVDGRITIVSGMPHAAGRVRYTASNHMARLVIILMQIDPLVRSGIDFANPPGFSDWMSGYCRDKGWTIALVDRRDEPSGSQNVEGSTMQWKAREAIRAVGGKIPKIICDAGGQGKEPVCTLTGNEPVGVAHDVCEIARAWAQSLHVQNSAQ
jgi:predicted fused transcriptional regulator/phosphomethylpyrimidine kinase